MNATLNRHDPVRDFPYDLAQIYANLYSRFQKHADLCRREIIDLKAEVARLENELETLKK